MATTLPNSNACTKTIMAHIVRQLRLRPYPLIRRTLARNSSATRVAVCRGLAPLGDRRDLLGRVVVGQVDGIDPMFRRGDLRPDEVERQAGDPEVCKCFPPPEDADDRCMRMGSCG